MKYVQLLCSLTYDTPHFVYSRLLMLIRMLPLRCRTHHVRRSLAINTSIFDGLHIFISVSICSYIYTDRKVVSVCVTTHRPLIYRLPGKGNTATPRNPSAPLARIPNTTSSLLSANVASIAEPTSSTPVQKGALVGRHTTS